ncbi:hypothetical protein H1S01_18605 [Heliobacterium chlorum]|uniref:Copper amine oxidase-like N-terminal domain-containing protein n=1 Tax=Heliobacterium chlorum TaxID=2698 RepID=A0ABR7T9Q0_HELCL|nr:stalk domain-containing protein [Heliobacterium chlorum]MBC9786471.1 hypothetical protein [Heliobacterium chlorum]
MACSQHLIRTITVVFVALYVTLYTVSAVANYEPDDVTAIVLTELNSEQILEPNTVISLFPPASEVVVLKAILKNGSEEVVSNLAFWESSNPEVVSVGQGPDNGGAFQALGFGKATVTANYKGFTARLNVEVSPITDMCLLFRDNVQGDRYPIFKENDTFLIPIDAKIMPYIDLILANGSRLSTSGDIYVSNNEQVVSFGRRHLLILHNKGNTTLTVRYGDYITRDFKIRVVSNDQALPRAVLANEKQLDFYHKAIYGGNVLYVPLREILEAFGYDIHWDESTHLITATAEDTSIQIVIGSDKAKKNGEEISFGYPVEVMNGHTIVPISFIKHVLTTNIHLDENDRTIHIYI